MQAKTNCLHKSCQLGGLSPRASRTHYKIQITLQVFWKHAHEVLCTEFSQLRDQGCVSSTGNVLFTSLWALVDIDVYMASITSAQSILRALNRHSTNGLIPLSFCRDTLEALCGTLVCVLTCQCGPVLLWHVEMDLGWADGPWDGPGSSLQSIVWAPPPSIVTQLVQMSFTS